MGRDGLGGKEGMERYGVEGDYGVVEPVILWEP